MPSCRAALLALPLVLTACGLAASDTPQPDPQPGSIDYQLSCDAPIVGEVKTWVTYTVAPSAEPVRGGETVTYRISAPPARVDSAVGTSFVSSKVTYPLPRGLDVLDVDMNPHSTADVSSAHAALSGGAIVVEEKGDYPLDGSERALPALVIRGKVTAEAGGTVELLTPSELQGTAHAGIFGDQSSTCHVIAPGPIFTSTVE
jgi:hypothetical protein